MADEKETHTQTRDEDVTVQAEKLGVEVADVVAGRISEENLMKLSADSLTLWSKTGVRFAGLMFVMACNQAAYGVDWGVIGGVSAFDRWHDFYGFENSGWKIGTVNGIMQIGTFVGAPFLALSDVIGRRGVNWLGNFLTIIGAFMQAWAPNFGTLLAGRFVLGFGTALCTAPQYIAELAPAHLRGRIVGVFGAFFQVGSMMMLGIMIGLTKIESNMQWRLAFMLQSVFPVLVCLLIYVLCPESPRYLVMKGKYEQARKVIAEYQTTSADVNEPIVGAVMQQIEESLEETKTSFKASYDFRVFFTKAVGYRTVVLVIYSIFQQWNGGGIMGYYGPAAYELVGIDQPMQQLGINLGNVGIYFVFTLVGAYIIDKFRRRTLIFVGIILFVIFQTCVTITSWQFSVNENKSNAILTIFWMFCFQVASATFIATLHNLYPVEILSLPLRAKGLGLYAMIQGAAGVVNTYGISVGINKLGYKIWVVFIVYNVIQGVIAYYLFPETSKLSLEEIDKVFETPGANPVKLSLQIYKAREEREKADRDAQASSA